MKPDCNEEYCSQNMHGSAFVEVDLKEFLLDSWTRRVDNTHVAGDCNAPYM